MFDAQLSALLGIDSTGAGCSSTLSRADLDAVAARLRPMHVFFAFRDADGKFIYADPVAVDFFQRYVLPLTVRPEIDPAFGLLMCETTFGKPGSPAGSIVLIGKAREWAINPIIATECTRLGLDQIWLESQATTVGCTERFMLEGLADMATSMLRDLQRLRTTDHEVQNLSTQLGSTYEELTFIYRLNSEMRINRNVDSFFEQTLPEAVAFMQLRGMGVALCDEAMPSHRPMLFGSIALPADQLARLSSTVLDRARQNQDAQIITNLYRDPLLAWLAPQAQQIMVVPMMRQQRLLGCLIAIDKTGGIFDTGDSGLLVSIANQSAVHLENAILFDDAHGLMMGLLHSLTSAVDAKDAYTCGHSERVAELACRIALQYGLSAVQAERVYMASLLHDVGKIGVPEAVLQKAGRLTTDEFEQMKRHPAIGAKILATIHQIKDMVQGVLYHHERFDGRGYPEGLSGDNIPLMGRIICLADCFDAMTSNRTYRRAMPIEAAILEIARCSGTQFDPKIVDAFMTIGEVELRSLLTKDSPKMRLAA